jgi:hypothetical protein
LDRIQQLQWQQEQARQQAEQLELQRQQKELERQRQAKIEAEQKRQAELAARRQQQEQEAAEKRRREAEIRQQLQAEAELKPSQPTLPDRVTSLSRRQVLRWGGLSSVGLISILGINEAFSNRFSNIDYNQLETSLKGGKWKEADMETLQIMLNIVNPEKRQLDSSDINRFPCKVLGEIDQRWVEFSQGKFGFSVQNNIYLEDLGGKSDSQFEEDIWYSFGDKVGWRVNGIWLTSLDTQPASAVPGGQLPWALYFGISFGGVYLPRRGNTVGQFFASLMAKIKECNINQ